MTKRARRYLKDPVLRARRRQRRAWMVAGFSVAAFVIASAAVRRTGGPLDHHPTPRVASEQARVLPASRYVDYPRVQEAYKMAAQVTDALDGIYCYCECAEHMGHYSLLECFSSDHAAGCDVCMSEGTLVYKMIQKGAALDAIRAEIDHTFGA
ncbi:MAG: PCYCGC domain-containing protein [Gemmatimonadetes bacterium]|nr:PCYCGC domain-containing protein [Gemmatimonadota bacterium]